MKYSSKGGITIADTNKKKPSLSFPVFFEVDDKTETTDSRFTKVKVWLMHLGENFNGSVFNKSVVDKALPTLGYIPIVGFIDSNKAGENDFSDHRYVITKENDGVKEKYLGTAYGVITSPDDNNAHYEERECDDGETRTFLVVDGLIWNMFEDSSDIIHRDLIKSQSMELWNVGDSYEGYEDDDGIFHFTKFSFRAACILGKDQEPAMMNSTVEVQFSMKGFASTIYSELSRKIEEFTNEQNKEKQGGITDMPKPDFTQTVIQQFEDISNIVLEHETFENRWGDSISRYYLSDIQENEAIVVDCKDNYRTYGFAFTVNGDKPEIDFSKGSRKKVQYVNYEDGSPAPDGAFDFGTHIAQMEEAASTKYTQVKSDYDRIKPKYDAFVKAEQERMEAETTALKQAEFAKYETALADDSDFIALKGKMDELSVKEIEGECAILFARKTLKANFSKSSKEPLAVGVLEGSDDGAGLLLSTRNP